MTLKLTKTGRAVLEYADKLAKERASVWPNEIDVLNALIELSPPIIDLAIEQTRFRDLDLQILPPTSEILIDDESRFDAFLKRVDTIAGRLGHKYPGPEHLLLALVSAPSEDVFARLTDMDLTPKTVYERVLFILGEFEIPEAERDKWKQWIVDCGRETTE